MAHSLRCLLVQHINQLMLHQRAPLSPLNHSCLQAHRSQEECRSSAGCCLSSLLVSEKREVEQWGLCVAPPSSWGNSSVNSLFFKPLPLKKSTVSKQGTAAQLASAKTLLVEILRNPRREGRALQQGKDQMFGMGKLQLLPVPAPGS